MMEEVKLAFDRENITIPFPQRDVHLIQAVTKFIIKTYETALSY